MHCATSNISLNVSVSVSAVFFVSKFSDAYAAFPFLLSKIPSLGVSSKGNPSFNGRHAVASSSGVHFAASVKAFTSIPQQTPSVSSETEPSTFMSSVVHKKSFSDFSSSGKA